MDRFTLGVRIWPIATFPCAAKLGRFRGIADVARFVAGSTRSRMTRSGHPTSTSGQHAVARSRNVRRRLGRPRCAGELVVEARRNDRPRARPPTRRFRPPAGPGLADVHHPGQARQASVMAVHRQPSASTRCSESTQVRPRRARQRGEPSVEYSSPRGVLRSDEPQPLAKEA